MLRNVTKRPLNDKENKKDFLDDIRIMHLATSAQIFEKLAKLFVDKWSAEEEDFVKYFQQEWLTTHCNWFESAAFYTPSTNNNLEGNFCIVKLNLNMISTL